MVVVTAVQRMLPKPAGIWVRSKSDHQSRRPRRVRDYLRSAGGQCPLASQNGRRETKESKDIVYYTHINIPKNVTLRRQTGDCVKRKYLKNKDDEARLLGLSLSGFLWHHETKS